MPDLNFSSISAGRRIIAKVGSSVRIGRDITGIQFIYAIIGAVKEITVGAKRGT
jgi:hypothetical protein